MGRLINTDDLIGCAIIKPTTSEEFGHILACENKIVHDDIPTVFDVEAVVKQIEELPTKKTTKMVESKEVPEWFYEVVTGEYIKKNDVVEIVRNGGVSNVGL